MNSILSYKQQLQLIKRNLIPYKQGNFSSKQQLYWKSDLEEDAEKLGEPMKSTNYAGIVKGVRRVRKLEVNISN